MSNKSKGRPVPERTTDPRNRLTGELKQGSTYVTSIYGYNTRRPAVEITLPEREPIVLETDDARLIAGMIVQAAESAEQDGFLIEWAMAQLEMTIEQAYMILNEYRSWREARRNAQKTKSA